jgi:hypothetical protein
MLADFATSGFNDEVRPWSLRITCSPWRALSIAAHDAHQVTWCRIQKPCTNSGEGHKRPALRSIRPLQSCRVCKLVSAEGPPGPSPQVFNFTISNGTGQAEVLRYLSRLYESVPTLLMMSSAGPMFGVTYLGPQQGYKYGVRPCGTTVV